MLRRDDITVDASASVRTATVGASPHRQFVIEWRNVAFVGATTQRLRFEIVFYEESNKRSKFHYEYRDVATGSRERGGSATIGAENANGTKAVTANFDSPRVTDGTAILVAPK